MISAFQLNAPLWRSSEGLVPSASPSQSTGAYRATSAFHEVWFLKFNDPVSQNALWLRLTLLISANGFRRVAETWAVLFQRGADGEVNRVALKQTHDIRAYSYDAEGDGTIRIGDCELSTTHSKGSITSKGRTLRWDLRLEPGHDVHFSLLPGTLQRLGIVSKGRATAVTVGEDLRVTGTAELSPGGEAEPVKLSWNSAAGMQGHLSGSKPGHSWVWGQCNLFVDDEGRPVPFLFEGISGRARLMGTVPSPLFSAFYFFYEGRAYEFNSVWDSFQSKSRSSLTGWEFQAERGDLSFRGEIKAELKHFAGLTYEDTNGSLLYCANSKLSDMRIHVYRKGKLETTLYSRGTTAFEVVGREKNPYVPLLV